MIEPDIRRAMNLQKEIDKIINGFSGQIGYVTRSTTSEEEFFANEKIQFPVASCIKLPIIIELLYRNKEGNPLLTEKVILEKEDQVPGTGVLKDLDPGLEFSLSDLAKLSITISDNTAANILIDRLGIDSINARIRSLGMKSTHVGTKFVFTDPTKNVGSPLDFCNSLTKLIKQTIVDKDNCEWLIDVMERQQYMENIPRYLPYNRFAEEFGITQKLRIANKIGMLSGVINDMAIISNQDFKYILVIFTKNCKDLTFGPDNEGAKVVAIISKLFYDYFKRRSYE